MVYGSLTNAQIYYPVYYYPVYPYFAPRTASLVLNTTTLIPTTTLLSSTALPTTTLLAPGVSTSSLLLASLLATTPVTGTPSVSTVPTLSATEILLLTGGGISNTTLLALIAAGAL
ncbi:MAG: hypothetical protein ACMUIP_15825 [bacterium]